jgi:lipoate-protein ligase B
MCAVFAPIVKEADTAGSKSPAGEDPRADRGTLVSFWMGLTPYRHAHELQLSLVHKRAQGECADVLLLLQHFPTITCGRSASDQEIEAARRVAQQRAADVVECERGGRLTFHGPGQLVAYPVVHLQAVGRDLHRWLWTLEEATLRTLQFFGVRGNRWENFRGVWVEDKKIASVGVAVRRWVSYHGVAINVRCDWPKDDGLSWCGFDGSAYTSLADLGVAAELQHVGKLFAGWLAALCKLKLVGWAQYPVLQPRGSLG